MKLADVKPIKLDAIHKNLKEFYDFQVLALSDLRQPKDDVMKMLFRHILLTSPIQFIFDAFLEAPLTAQVVNQLHHNHLRYLAVLVLQYAGYEDAESFISKQFFYSPFLTDKMNQFRILMTAFLKIGRKYKEQEDRILQISEEIALESKNQDNLFENLQNLDQKYQEKNHELEILEEDQKDLGNQQKINEKESENLTNDNQAIEEEILEFKNALDQVHEKHKPMIQMIENCKNDIKFIMDKKLDSEDQAYTKMLKENQGKNVQAKEVFNKTRADLTEVKKERNSFEKARAINKKLATFLNDYETILVTHDEKQAKILAEKSTATQTTLIKKSEEAEISKVQAAIDELRSHLDHSKNDTETIEQNLRMHEAQLKLDQELKEQNNKEKELSTNLADFKNFVDEVKNSTVNIENKENFNNIGKMFKTEFENFIYKEMLPMMDKVIGNENSKDGSNRPYISMDELLEYLSGCMETLGCDFDESKIAI